LAIDQNATPMTTITRKYIAQMKIKNFFRITFEWKQVANIDDLSQKEAKKRRKVDIFSVLYNY
jgi:hypothetical protein